MKLERKPLKIVPGAILILAILSAAYFWHFHAGTFEKEHLSHSEMRLLMDTVITINVYTPEAEVAKYALEKGFAEFEKVEKQASFHLEKSELNLLNRKKTIKPGPVLADLLSLTKKFHQETDGYFDPTFAKLHQAYGFYDKKGRLPDSDELSLALSHTGYGKQVEYNNQNGQYNLASGALLDFGGLAGGYAIEKAAQAMRRASCTVFLIDDSGDIWLEGNKPDGSPWRIAVRDPRDNGTLAVVESMEPVAISTSGNYERFVTVDGKKYGHIMNPLTGRPADYYQSLTIVASTALQADAYSTSLYAMPPAELFAWAEARSVPILVLTSNNELRLNRAGEKWFKNLKK
jgi:thiamine biosynthesis lipoprotein